MKFLKFISSRKTYYEFKDDIKVDDKKILNFLKVRF